MAEKITLSQPTEFVLRGGVTVKVYPASLEVISQLSPKITELEDMAKGNDLKAQINLFMEVVYDLLKDDNDVKRADLKKALTIEACTKIIQTAMGSLGSLAS